MKYTDNYKEYYRIIKRDYRNKVIKTRNMKKLWILYQAFRNTKKRKEIKVIITSILDKQLRNLNLSKYINRRIMSYVIN